MTHTVTVIMPAYNAADFVGEAIDSVLAQTFTDWELVVVDDGSTDETPEVVADFDDPRIRLHGIGHSGLPAVVRNRGLAVAESPYIAFLNADDLWRPHKLSRQVALLGSKPDVGLVFTDFEQLREGALEPVVHVPGLRASEPQFERLAAGNFIANSSVLLRRELVERHGAFDEDPRLRGTEDFELWLRLSPQTTFAYVDEPLIVYRLHSSNLGQGEQMGLGYVAAMEKMERLYPDLVAGLGPPYWRLLGYIRCYFGLKGRGRWDLLRVIRRRPSDSFAWTWLARSLLPAPLLREYGGFRPWIAARLRRRT